MSTANPPAASTTIPGVGLGYGIAIAVSILVLISSIMLASYACIRVKANASSSRSSSSSSDDAAEESGREAAAVLVFGLDGSIINSYYPKTVLGESLRMPMHSPSDGTRCSICLCDYEANDSVRCIPDCHHCFHATCVDEWLKMSATCPLCRSSPATPLAEVLPLPFHDS